MNEFMVYMAMLAAGFIIGALVTVPIANRAYNHLIKVITDVHSQHADDLCWMPADVNKIFQAAGLPPQDLRVGDKEAMRKNCHRYLDVLEEGGPWKSYAELEQENEQLRNQLANAGGYKYGH